MFFPVFLLKIFNWRVMLYKVVLVSAVQQHESAIGIRIISFLNLPPGPRPTPLDRHRTLVWAPRVIWRLPPSYLFARGSVFMSMLLSQFVP